MRWDEKDDFLAFSPDEGQTECAVHRRAFRALVGREPDKADCLRFFAANRQAFEAAAHQKRRRAGLGPGARYHVNSRDVRRALSALDLGAAKAAEEEPGQRPEQGP